MENWKHKSALIPIILLPFFFLLEVYFIAIDKGTGNWLPLVFSFILIIPTMALSLLGLLLAMNMLVKKENLIIAIILILISAVMIYPPFSIKLEKNLASYFVPSIKESYTTKVKQDFVKYENLKFERYNMLLQHFKYPQKIKDVKYNYLLLEDNKVVKLNGISEYNISVFETYIKGNIINKNKFVQIRLLEYPLFKIDYVPGQLSSVFSEFDTSYGEIPALIFVDGELLNMRYAEVPENLRKYQELYDSGKI